MSMAMDCCHKEYVEECEILVCVDALAPHSRTLYNRLCFGLLVSSWLPRPQGIFLWSALHVILLIVSGPVFWVLGLLTAFVYVVGLIGFWFIFFGSFYVVFGCIAVAVDLILLLGKSIWFCGSLVGFLACHERIVEWRDGVCWIVVVWKSYKSFTMDMFWAFVPFGVPCMSRSLYKQSKDRKLKTWARWCEEVVHMHDAIAL